MAESRRVQLTTLTCDAAPTCDAPPTGDDPVVAQKSPSCAAQGKERSPGDTDTVRLVVALFEPDDRSFPEFSYSQLVDNKISHRIKDEAPLSRFEKEENRQNDELADIARKMEEKYAGKPKKKRDRVQDLIDIGYGYDDEDSFIDNSEAYDEFVPSAITTKFGGFYVNSGVLQFRAASDTETDDFTTAEKTPEPSKKRKLDGQERPEKKLYKVARQMKLDVEAGSSPAIKTAAEDEMRKRKKKKVAGPLSVTSMLRKFQREKDRERQKTGTVSQRPAAITGTPTMLLCPADAAGGGGSGLADPLLSLIGSTNDHALIQAASAVDFDIDLDSLLDVTEETLSKSVPQPPKEKQLHQVKTGGQTQASVSSDAQATPTNKTHHLPRPPPEQVQVLSEAKSTSSHQFVPLPDGLPPELEDRIKELMLAAKTSEGESKLKFFTPQINSILLEIEFQCRELGGNLRSRVLTHLSSFLPCSRDTLLKRVKKLTLLTPAEDRPDVEDPVQRLKEAVGRAMPEQIACFHVNCQAYEQLKTSRATEEAKDGKQKVNAGPEDGVEERGGKRGGPRKLFRWNQEIRECLGHVLKSKTGKYETEGKGSQELEMFLKTFLENDVKPIWPKGWMQSRMLMRESKKLTGLFTSLLVKKPRPERKPFMSDAPTMIDSCSFLQGPPPLKGGPPQQPGSVVNGGSNISKLIPPDAAKKETAAVKMMEGKTGDGSVAGAGSSPPVEADKHPSSTTSPPTHPSGVPADRAPAREQPGPVSQELLAAAVAKYKRSVQNWSFSAEMKSPPFPPPPPQCSPVGISESRMGQGVVPLLLQGLTRLGDAGQVHILSDDEDVIML